MPPPDLHTGHSRGPGRTFQGQITGTNMVTETEYSPLGSLGLQTWYIS